MKTMVSPLHRKNTKDQYLPMNNWGKMFTGLAVISLLTLSGPGCVMAVVFLICMGGTLKDNPDYVPPLKRAQEWITGKSEPKQRPVRAWSWKDQHEGPVTRSQPVAKEKTLAITNHARRNLALRHGVAIKLTHLKYEELTPFEEEGEGCYITLFPEINKSKKFAVFIDEDKTVIKTFCPHTDYKRNRAYFKKHTNLDNSLKDDMTKDLEFLQKVWLDKIV